MQRGAVGMRGGAAKRLRGVGVLDDAAAEEHGHLLADLCDHPEIVRDEEKRGAVARLHFGDEAQDLLLHGHVERGRRLVGDDELWLGGEGGGDQHALAHAARELMRIARQHPLRIGDVHLGEKIAARARAPWRGSEPEDRGQPVGHLPVDAAHRIEGGERILRDEARRSAR